MIIKNERGQTLILMLIVTIISLTVGVAISSRAVSTLKQTSYTAQAGKAQKFADAGVEHALPNPAAWLSCTAATPCGLDLDSGGNDVEYTVTQSGDGPSVEIILEKDQTVEVDLYNPDTGTRYPSDRAIRIYWVLKGDAAEDKDEPGNDVNNEAAIVIALIYNEGGETKLAKYAFDPNEADRGNNFDVPSTGSYVIGTNTYKYMATIGALGAGKDYEALRVNSKYNTVTNTAVVTNDGVLGTFPTQGYTITSTGTYGEAEWTAEVTKMNPALPSIFDYAIFSGSDLTK